MAAPVNYIKKDFMVKRSLMKSWLIKKENYKSRWFLLTEQCLCYCDGSLQVCFYHFNFNTSLFWDLEGGSQKATLVVLVVVVSSPESKNP